MYTVVCHDRGDGWGAQRWLEMDGHMNQMFVENIKEFDERKGAIGPARQAVSGVRSVGPA